MAEHPIDVRLSQAEMGQAERVSSLRYLLSRAAGIQDKLIDTSRSGKDTDLPGIKGEIAVAKLMGIPFNVNELGVDNGCDLYLNVGNKDIGIQVKSTHHKNAKWLLGTPHAKASWDIAVLTRPTDEDNVMQVYGWISFESYQARLEVVDLGHGPGKGVSIEHLNPMEVLWRRLMIRRLA